MKIILYSCSANKIGGVETFNRNFVKRMSKSHDIIFVYESGDKERLKEMSKYCTVMKYEGQIITGDICIWSTAWGERPEKNIRANKHFQMVHADYEAYIKDWNFTYKKLDCVDEHIAVSENSARGLKNVYGYDSTVIYNLLDNEVKVKKNKTKPLIFITASRLSAEKGMERLIKLARMFKEAGKKFIWYVYGDSPAFEYIEYLKKQSKDIPEIIWMGSKLSLTQEIADADYLGQLSDTEGFPYSPYEALQVGTPCILTNYKSVGEMVEDGVNGYILEMDLSNVDIDKIFNNIPKFKFKEKSSEEDWERLFKKKYKPKKIIIPETVKAVVLMPFTDKYTGKKYISDRILELTKDRYIELYNLGLVEMR